MARREYQGGAVSTTITGGITNVSTSLILASATGWPTGVFSAVIDPGQAGEEKILCTSRSGTTVTITTRGYDGTAASSHTANAVIYPVPTAVDFDESNSHINSALGATAIHGLAGAIVGTTDTQTITNKTLTQPVIDNFKMGYTTVATAAGTTVLTATSNQLNFFTGVTTQTVTLPVASTLVLGQYFLVRNNSSGIVTVQSSGGNTILAMPANTKAIFTCILTSATDTTSWSSAYTGFGALTGTGSVVLGTSPTLTSPTINTPVLPLLTTTGDIIYASSASTPARLGAGTLNTVLTSGGPGVAPSWAASSAGALTKISTGTFSAVANTGATFDGVFTSAYKSYMVACKDISASAGTPTIYFQFRVAGVTTAANYYGTCFGYSNAAVLTAIQTSATSQLNLFAIDTNKSSFSFIANHVGSGSQIPDITGNGYSKAQTTWFTFGCLTNAAVMDGFILSLSAGTISGEITVYGLAN